MSLRDHIKSAVDELKTKVSHQKAGYHRGHGPSGSHCSICEYYINNHPPSCRKVVQPIRPDDGCKLFEPKDKK